MESNTDSEIDYVRICRFATDHSIKDEELTTNRILEIAGVAEDSSVVAGVDDTTMENDESRGKFIIFNFKIHVHRRAHHVNFTHAHRRSTV
jgi:hypothetical protein